GKANISLLTGVMDQLTEEIMHKFFLEPTKEVKMGFVTQKTLNVGVEGSRKAIQAVTNRVMGELSEESLSAFLQHLGQSMLQRYILLLRGPLGSTSGPQLCSTICQAPLVCKRTMLLQRVPYSSERINNGASRRSSSMPTPVSGSSLSLG